MPRSPRTMPQRAGILARWLLRKGKQVLRFYREHGPHIVREFQHLFRRASKAPLAPNRIRLPWFDVATRSTPSLNLALPAHCVACGGMPAAGGPTVEFVRLDLRKTCACLMVALGAAAAVVWFLGGWYVPLPVLVGLVAGYVARSPRRIVVSYEECPSHQHNGLLPSVELLGGDVFLEVGTSALVAAFETERRSARLRWLIDKTRRDQPAASLPGHCP